MQCFGHHFNSTEIWFHDKPNKKHIGSSPEADSPRSNDRHFEGNGLFQGPISKLHAMITSVKGSQEIKMRSCVPSGNNGRKGFHSWMQVRFFSNSLVWETR